MTLADPAKTIIAVPPDYWQKAKRHLIKNDPTLATIIRRYKGEMLESRGHAFQTLVRSIIGQQISVKAAESVWKRFEAAVNPSLGELAPQAILALPDETLRACGLSGSKVVYVKALATHFLEADIHAEDYWLPKTDAEIIKELSLIRGIGVWTAEMFLIFHLMRPDVLPLGDIGLLNAVAKLYDIPAKDKKAIAAHAERWRPYRSVATWYLWRSLDPIPVKY